MIVNGRSVRGSCVAVRCRITKPGNRITYLLGGLGDRLGKPSRLLDRAARVLGGDSVRFEGPGVGNHACTLRPS